MFYVLSGFIADVCCGRLKVVVIGLRFVFPSTVLMCLAEILAVSATSVNHYNYFDIYIHDQEQGITILFLSFTSLVAFIIGLAGYQENVTQLGLDQLFEAPSQYLSLFILSDAVWAFKLGSGLLMVFIPLLLCTGLKPHLVATRVLYYCLLLSLFF